MHSNLMFVHVKKNPTTTMTTRTMADICELCLVKPVIGEIRAGARSKTASLLDNGSHVTFKIGSPECPAEVPFHPSAFGDSEATRASLLLVLQEQQSASLSSLEAKILECMKPDAARFGRNLTAQTLESQWRSCLKILKDGRVCVKVKVNTTGPHAVKCWLPNGQTETLPENMAGFAVSAHIHVRGIWLSSSGIGLQLECSDVLIVNTQDSQVSPWGAIA